MKSLVQGWCSRGRDVEKLRKPLEKKIWRRCGVARNTTRECQVRQGCCGKKLALEKIKPRDGAENASGRVYFREYEPGAGTSFRRAIRFAGSAREQEALPKASLPL